MQINAISNNTNFGAGYESRVQGELNECIENARYHRNADEVKFLKQNLYIINEEMPDAFITKDYMNYKTYYFAQEPDTGKKTVLAEIDEPFAKLDKDIIAQIARNMLIERISKYENKPYFNDNDNLYGDGSNINYSV